MADRNGVGLTGMTVDGTAEAKRRGRVGELER